MVNRAELRATNEKERGPEALTLRDATPEQIFHELSYRSTLDNEGPAGAVMILVNSDRNVGSAASGGSAKGIALGIAVILQDKPELIPVIGMILSQPGTLADNVTKLAGD